VITKETDQNTKQFTEQFEERKRDHIRHALESAHQATGLSGLDSFHLTHEALPDFDFSEIKLETTCLGMRLPTPFYVAGMTAGHENANAINRALARACAERGWGFGVGSQRRQLTDGTNTDRWVELRKEFPDLAVFANIGITQIADLPIEKVRELVDSIQARALCVHVNALQEALQPEGTPNFRGAFAALAQLIRELELPVVLKETGCGFSRATLARIAENLSPLGLAGVDVSGLGGTHWGRIEGARAEEKSRFAKAAETFANWGEPTAEVVMNASEIFAGTRTEIWASGGVRSGLDAAKLIALGANRVGYAQPALQAVLQGPEHLTAWMEQQEFELKVALFCTGHRTPELLCKVSTD
jgi:isopentenyl-diphosphate delta-isomerase